MAATTHPVAHDGHSMTQSHADITRDVVATLGPPTRGYVVLLFGAVSLLLVGILTFLILVKDGYLYWSQGSATTRCTSTPSAWS